MLKKNFKKTSLKKFVYVFVTAIGVVMVWRAMWNFLDHYLLPDHFVLSNVISLLVGILILWIPDHDIDELF